MFLHRWHRVLSPPSGSEVHTGTKGRSTIGGGPHSTLHLDVVHRSGNIGEIHPVHRMGFGIIEGDSVDGHIDPVGIRSPDPHGGIADPVAASEEVTREGVMDSR